MSTKKTKMATPTKKTMPTKSSNVDLSSIKKSVMAMEKMLNTLVKNEMDEKAQELIDAKAEKVQQAKEDKAQAMEMKKMKK